MPDGGRSEGNGPRLLIAVTVTTATDRESVRAVLTDIMSDATHEVAGLRSEPSPEVRTMSPHAGFPLSFALICSVNTVLDRFPVERELRRRIIRQLRADELHGYLAVRAVDGPDMEPPRHRPARRFTDVVRA